MEGAVTLTEDIHDLLVAMKPSDLEHGPANCGVCKARLTPPIQEGSVGTYTDEQVQAKVDEATAELRAELDSLRQAATAGEIDGKIAEATQPFQDKIVELETDKDTLTAELNSVKEERDALVQANTDREAAEQAAEEREGRKADRVAKVLEVAKFTDEQVAERADLWADMDDKSFDTLVADLAAIATSAPAGEYVPRPVLRASEDRPAAGGALSPTMREAMGYRRQGIKNV